MDVDGFVSAVCTSHPGWKIGISRYGITDWLDITVDDNRHFTIEVSPRGEVGVSELGEDSELDFGGHDEAFSGLGEALRYIEKKLPA